jgi:hypothetical protein
MAAEQRGRDTAEIMGDARGEVLRFCLMTHDEVPRLDALARTLRSLNGGSTDRIQRPELLSTLLLSGLDLATTDARTLVIFPGHGVRYELTMKLEDVERVTLLSFSRWPVSKGRPTPGYFHGALIRIALRAAEAEESFSLQLASRLLSASESAHHEIR